MDKEAIGYCGLNCERCQTRFTDIRDKANALLEAMDAVNFSEMAKVIPFMGFKYNRFMKVIEFVNYKCPGCRQGGGNPFCGTRKCATKRGYSTCAECEQLCKRFNVLFKIHTDNEIQDNIERIRKESQVS